MQKATITMSTETHEGGNNLGTLAEDAIALMNATADVGGEKVVEARNRLAAALESGKRLYGQVKDKVVEGAKATDSAVHQHPYTAIGVAVGLGALVGYLLARRCTRHCN